ncbi:MAG: hypothetical protein ACKVU1_16305 [bacterium]
MNPASFAKLVARARRTIVAAAIFVVLTGCGGSDDDEPMTPDNADRISTDAELFALVTQVEPFAGYTLFPNADSVVAGRLNGSEAHGPLVRVSLNAKAASALVDGKLPVDGSFPDSSIVFKELRSGTTPTYYAIMYKDRDNPLAANGWVWGEYRTSGSIVGSVMNGANGCAACHMREQGPANDLVRTFERQLTR